MPLTCGAIVAFLVRFPAPTEMSSRYSGAPRTGWPTTVSGRADGGPPAKEAAESCSPVRRPRSARVGKIERTPHHVRYHRVHHRYGTSLFRRLRDRQRLGRVHHLLSSARELRGPG